jgi:hypothetical protein
MWGSLLHGVPLDTRDIASRHRGRDDESEAAPRPPVRRPEEQRTERSGDARPQVGLSTTRR